ncbi:hypothetical protein KC19_6G120300 [Ceratodon purpureus]|uniref:Uncharacterized protein n=1 Tax=Ceratodon purpureus TaxID=3225 RepID=A0A8T0HDI0_CERPU|nr:hypothetical protein KC19_6G120300 [Ceratodon purpureus]
MHHSFSFLTNYFLKVSPKTEQNHINRNYSHIIRTYTKGTWLKNKNHTLRLQTSQTRNKSSLQVQLQFQLHLPHSTWRWNSTQWDGISECLIRCMRSYRECEDLMEIASMVRIGVRRNETDERKLRPYMCEFLYEKARMYCMLPDGIMRHEEKRCDDRVQLHERRNVVIVGPTVHIQAASQHQQQQELNKQQPTALCYVMLCYVR